MLRRFSLNLLLLLTTFGAVAQVNKSLKVVSSPAIDKYTQINKTGTTVIPNGRFIAPYGKTIDVAPHPYGLTLSADGSVAVTANSGTSPISISIIKDLQTDHPTVIQVPPGPSTDKGVLASVFMGLAISPDNKVVYVSGGQLNKIYLFSVETGAKLDSVDCSVTAEGERTPDGYIGDLKLSRDGRYLYAVDQMLFRMIVIDTQVKKVVASAKTGRYPFGIILSPDQQKVYVANVGMFEYRKISDIEEKKDYQKALDFPAFGFNTEEMKKGTRIDSLEIPGLGDPNVPESFWGW
jgi:DNA-binding beta-propeller fold protein YncE